MPGGDPGSPGQGEFSHVDLAVLFSDPPADGSATPGAPDAALGAGILTVDLTPAGTSLGGDGGTLPKERGRSLRIHSNRS